MKKRRNNPRTIPRCNLRVTRSQAAAAEKAKRKEDHESSVARVILAVVALHVLVIGGMFLFDGCIRNAQLLSEPASEDEFEPEPVPAPPTEPVILRV